MYKIIFIYADGKKLTISDKTFDEAVKLVLNGSFNHVGTPIKLVIPSIDIILYFDDDHFRNYIQGTLDYAELEELTECDGLYRNKVPIHTPRKTRVEVGSLWKKRGEYLALIDQDDYIEVYKEFPEGFTEV